MLRICQGAQELRHALSALSVFVGPSYTVPRCPTAVHEGDGRTRLNPARSTTTLLYPGQQQAQQREAAAFDTSSPSCAPSPEQPQSAPSSRCSTLRVLKLSQQGSLESSIQLHVSESTNQSLSQPCGVPTCTSCIAAAPLGVDNLLPTVRSIGVLPSGWWSGATSAQLVMTRQQLHGRRLLSHHQPMIVSPSTTHLRYATTKTPATIPSKSDVGELLDSEKVVALQALGFTEQQIAKMAQNPDSGHCVRSLPTASLVNRFQSIVNLGASLEQAVSMFNRHVALWSMHETGVLLQKVEWLRKVLLPHHPDIQKALRSSKAEAEHLTQQLLWDMLVRSPGVLKASIEAKLKPNLQYLQQHLGLPKEEVAQLVMRGPQILLGPTLSGSDSQAKRDYLTSVMQRDVRDVFKHPVYIHYSLSQRIGPRYHLLKYLGVDTGLAIASFLGISDANFISKYGSLLAERVQGAPEGSRDSFIKYYRQVHGTGGGGESSKAVSGSKQTKNSDNVGQGTVPGAVEFATFVQWWQQGPGKEWVKRCGDKK